MIEGTGWRSCYQPRLSAKKWYIARGRGDTTGSGHRQAAVFVSMTTVSKARSEMQHELQQNAAGTVGTPKDKKECRVAHRKHDSCQKRGASSNHFGENTVRRCRRVHINCLVVT